MLKALLHSRKFWLMIGAIVAVMQNGRPELIPWIILAEIGAITVEDAAAKWGLRVPAPDPDSPLADVLDRFVEPPADPVSSPGSEEE